MDVKLCAERKDLAQKYPSVDWVLHKKKQKVTPFFHGAGIAGRFFQLKTSHALIGPYLERIGKKDTSECWWCGQPKQMTDHLFKWCKKWKAQQDILWKELKKEVKWKDRHKIPILQVFAEEKAEESVIQFLKDTDIGRVTEA
ncbi:hypothetical protein K440DRAFT_642498 [Wilcoxina mikolae CBS 423.85]|nr:hypothetical protein K440DRAFT_642498 [Wilcoxina mikolae CBS 423.85]